MALFNSLSDRTDDMLLGLDPVCEEDRLRTFPTADFFFSPSSLVIGVDDTESRLASFVSGITGVDGVSVGVVGAELETEISGE
jgi:hypothetical protein